MKTKGREIERRGGGGGGGGERERERERERDSALHVKTKAIVMQLLHICKFM